MFRNVNTATERRRNRATFHDALPLSMPLRPPVDPEGGEMGSVAPPARRFVAAFPLDPIYAYWPETSPNGLRVMRCVAGLNRPAELAGSYPPAGDESYYKFDMTANRLRLWRVAGAATGLGNVSGLTAGRRAAAADDGRDDDNENGPLANLGPLAPLAELAMMDDRPDAEEDDDARPRAPLAEASVPGNRPRRGSGIVPAIARWVGRTVTEDPARPGLAAGRRAAVGVHDAIARTGVAAINAANRRAWGR